MTKFKQSIRNNIGKITADEAFQELKSGMSEGGRSLFNETSTQEEVLQRLDSTFMNIDAGTALKVVTPLSAKEML